MVHAHDITRCTAGKIMDGLGRFEEISKPTGCTVWWCGDEVERRVGKVLAP